MMKTLTLATAAAVIAITSAAAPAAAEVPISKLCPDQNARCKIRDNPEFYRELPENALGVWCSDGGAESEPFYWSNDQRHCRKEYEGDGIKITIAPRQYNYMYEPNTAKPFSYTCTVTTVTTRLDKSIIYSTKKMGVPVATFTADCREDTADLHYGKRFRCTWQERGTLYASQESLYFKQKSSVRKGNERCARAG